MNATVFLGTPNWSVPALEATLRTTEVRLVVTQPDRPQGRSKAPRPSPVKEAALALGLPIAQPAGRGELLDVIAGIAPVDLGVVVAFGSILPPQVLEIPRRGFVNVHFSVLPRWRGAAPVERAILAGDSATGVTLTAMDEGLDTGAVISTRTVSIGPKETSGELLDRLALLGVEVLEEDLLRYLDGFLIAAHQLSEGATYAKKIESAEGHLPLDSTVGEMLRCIRAFNPRPGAFGFLDDERLKVWVAERGSVEGLASGELRIVEDRLYLGARDGTLLLHEVQAPGGRRMPGIDWARGRRGRLGRLT